jgi:hypothetical protein
VLEAETGIKTIVVRTIDVAVGSFTSLPARAKIGLCPLYSVSDHFGRGADWSLSATKRHTDPQTLMPATCYFLRLAMPQITACVCMIPVKEGFRNVLTGAMIITKRMRVS